MKKGCLVLVIVIFLSGLVLADGGFFKQDIYRDKDLFEPEQKAVIVYGEEKEILVIQASYEGDVSEFAWIIPVPSYPELDKANSKIFEELHYLTNPKVIESISILDFFFSPGKYAKGVSVHEQGSVGIYDYSILSSEDSNALINWLNNNSYFIPEEANSVINYYIDKNWYFVALKYNRDNNPAMQILKEIDERIEDKDSVASILSEMIIDSLENKNNESINKILDLNISVDEEDVYDSYNQPSLLTSHDYKKYWDFYYDMEERDYRIFRSSAGTCSGRKGDCVRVGSFEFFLSKDSHGYEEGDRLIDEIKGNLLEDFMANRSFEDSYLNKLYEDDVVVSRFEKEKLRETYDRDLLHYNVPAEYVRFYYNRSLNKNFFLKFGISQDLSKGIISPVKLTFFSDKIVYPFKITSINKGKTEVLLYVFTDAKTRAKDFQIEYVGRIAISNSVYLSKLLNSEESYFLTKLRGEFISEEIDVDVIIENADDNEEYRMKIYQGGFSKWLGSIILTIILFYLLIILCSILPFIIINKIIKNKESSVYFTSTKFFIYPLVFIFIVLIQFLFPEFSRNYFSIIFVPFFILMFYLPIVGIIIAIIIFHLIVSLVIKIFRMFKRRKLNGMPKPRLKESSSKPLG